MYTLSKDCPRRDACVQHGKGLIHIKDLTDAEGLYGHGRMFAHITVDPGCSIGEHPHEHETEFYYIIRGEAVFNDNGTEVTVHAGDICATGFGERHAIENRTNTPVELIALIVLEHDPKPPVAMRLFCSICTVNDYYVKRIRAIADELGLNYTLEKITDDQQVEDMDLMKPCLYAYCGGCKSMNELAVEENPDVRCTPGLEINGKLTFWGGPASDEALRAELSKYA